MKLNKTFLLIIFAILLSSSFCVALPSDSIFMFYQMENDTSNTLVDTIGRNDGTNTNVDLKPGIVGVYGYNYTTAAVSTIPDTSDTVGFSGWTKFWWVKRYSIGNGEWPRFINKQGDFHGYEQFGNSYHWGELFQWAGGGDTGLMDTSFTPTNDVWTHMAVTYNGTTGLVRFYVNGTNIYNSSESSGKTLLDGSATITIAQDYTGTFDEVGMANVTFSPEDVMDLYLFGIDNKSYPFLADYDVPYVVNDSINFTSDGGQICGYNGSAYSDCGPTNDTTGTFTFTTTVNANCKLLTVAENYSTSSDSDCAATGTKSHTCIIDPALGLDTNLYQMYVACSNLLDSEYENNDFIYANTFNVSLDFTPGSGSAGGTSFCAQYLNVDSYTGLQTVYNLTVLCKNSETVDIEITANPDDNFNTSTSTFTIPGNGTNETVFTNVSVRGMTDGALFSIAGTEITGNFTQTTNTIQNYIRIDPPHAFTKDGNVDCTQNYLLSNPTLIDNNLSFIGTGETYLDSVLNITGNLIQIDTGCTFYINASGQLNINK